MPAGYHVIKLCVLFAEGADTNIKGIRIAVSGTLRRRARGTGSGIVRRNTLFS